MSIQYSKKTRMDHKKFYILESTCTTFPLTFGMKNYNNKMPNRSVIIILSSQFWMQWGHGSITTPKCFTCLSTELLLLPTTQIQLCIWHESHCLNSKIHAIFLPSGITHVEGGAVKPSFFFPQFDDVFRWQLAEVSINAVNSLSNAPS